MNKIMKSSYRLYKRGRTGVYYLQNNHTREQRSLQTSDKATAERLLNAENEAREPAALNLELGRVYIGATKIGSGVKYSLALFVLGVIFSGISKAMQFHYMDGLFKNWKALVNDYFAGKKSWEQIIALDEAAVGDNKWDYIIAYASFVCFIVGSVIGFIALV